MPNAKRKPFDFQDLAATPRRDAHQEEAITPANAVFSAADIAAARRDGHAQGLADARKETTAETSRALASIAATLAEDVAAFDTALAAERRALRAAAGAFLEQFARRFAKAREIEIAVDLLRRLLAASPDRAPAVLFLSPESFSRLESRLADEIAAQGASTFITLDADSALQPGECRVAWRGGGANRLLAASIAQIEQLVSPQGDGERPPKNSRRKKNPTGEIV